MLKINKYMYKHKSAVIIVNVVKNVLIAKQFIIRRYLSLVCLKAYNGYRKTCRF